MINRREHDRGAAAVEFALLVPILLALVFGIVEFGRAYYVQSTLAGAAREGVRVMALTNDWTQAMTAIEAYDPTLTVTYPDGPAPPCPPGGGGTTKVTVGFDFDFIAGFIPGLPATLPLEGTGTMRCNG